MTENLPMLPMKWGIIEVAREAGANILPAFLSYDNEKESDKVKLCEIQTHPDDDNRLIAHVVWENEVKELLKLQPEKEDDLLREIQEEVREDVNIEASVPRSFCVWDSFPRAHSGKRDISRIKKSKENLRIV